MQRRGRYARSAATLAATKPPFRQAKRSTGTAGPAPRPPLTGDPCANAHSVAWSPSSRETCIRCGPTNATRSSSTCTGLGFSRVATVTLPKERSSVRRQPSSVGSCAPWIETSNALGKRLSLTTAGAGPTPESLDPFLGATVSFDRDHLPTTSFFSVGSTTSDQYNFTFNQGFVTGSMFQFGFNNNRSATTNPTSRYSPEYLSNFRATVTQHLLQGAGIWVNKRFIYQALNDRRIVD